MSRSADKPIPLFPPYESLKDLSFDEYVQLSNFIGSGESWWKNHWEWAREFLCYTGRNKSEHTYMRFRNEVERFILWCFLIQRKPADTLKKSDILDYADFCWSPPESWICTANHDKFIYRNGEFQSNPKWAPYRLQTSKHEQKVKLDKKRYRPSQQTLTSSFTAVVAFYKYLMNEEYCYGNPAQIAN